MLNTTNSRDIHNNIIASFTNGNQEKIPADIFNYKTEQMLNEFK
jgi:hypothetical protein